MTTYIAKLGELESLEGKEAKITFPATHVLAVNEHGALIGIPKAAIGKGKGLKEATGKAESLRETFLGRRARIVHALKKLPVGRARWLGPIYRLEYSARKPQGEESYYHDFSYPRPVAFASGKGADSWIFFRGGSYKITAAGIDG